MIKHGRTYAEVDLNAIVQNCISLHENLNEGTKLMAVIKADGYGHGAVPIAHALEGLPFLWGYGVATAEEAFLLKDAGITSPVLILGYTFEEHHQEIIERGIQAAVFSMDMAHSFSEKAVQAGKSVKIHIKVDTGMGRVGYLPVPEAADEVAAIGNLPGIELEGIFTHFSKADETDKSYTVSQLEKYAGFLKELKKRDVDAAWRHCSNSAAAIDIPEANYDIVRTGISIYGLHPSEEVQVERVNPQPVLKWGSHVVCVKELPAGSRVSYGGTYTASEPVRVATIPVGYADGYPRSLSGIGYVLIRGMRAPILGRICMDQFMVDVTGIEGVSVLDEVVLVGRQREEQITVEELSALCGRFNYEFVCDIGRRVPRLYVSKEKI